MAHDTLLQYGDLVKVAMSVQRLSYMLGRSGVRVPLGPRDYSLLQSALNNSGTQQAFFSMTGVLFRG